MSQQVVVVNFLCYDILVLELLSKQQGLFTSVTQAPQGGGGGTSAQGGRGCAGCGTQGPPGPCRTGVGPGGERTQRRRKEERAGRDRGGARGVGEPSG